MLKTCLMRACVLTLLGYLKLGQRDGLTKRRTFVKLLKQTKRNPDKGSAKIINPVRFTGTDFSF